MLSRSDATHSSSQGSAASELFSWRGPHEVASPRPYRPFEPQHDQAAASAATRLLLTPTEAAARLSISRTKIYELMAAGTLRSIHIGRLRRVPVEALRDFVGALESR